MIWRLSPTAALSLDRPRILAIVNTTPDSFYAGSRVMDPGAAAEIAARVVEEGADALDLGAESTRPGAVRVTAEEQTARLLPVLRAIRGQSGPVGSIPITIDTTIAAVARACFDVGADAVNDVAAGLEDPELLPTVARLGRGVILMHRLTTPERDRYSDQYAAAPAYDDVVAAVRGFLHQRAETAIAAGVDAAGIVLDPGLGFGKSVEQNLALLHATDALAGGDTAGGRGRSRAYPVLSALSRKSFVGRVSLGRDSTPDERLEGTLGLSALHYCRGARLFRVHDVAAHRRALDAVHAADAAHAALAPPLP